jgi:hypothetical protein
MNKQHGLAQVVVVVRFVDLVVNSSTSVVVVAWSINTKRDYS